MMSDLTLLRHQNIRQTFGLSPLDGQDTRTLSEVDHLRRFERGFASFWQLFPVIKIFPQD